MDLTNNVIIHKNIDGTEFIQFRELLEYTNIKHCYTLKRNGINIQTKNGDKTELISSFKKIANVLNIDYKSIIKPYQTHTDKVEKVESSEEIFEEVDGLITNKNNIMLCTTSADCTSLIIYDDVKKVVCDVHSGWRGTVKKIAKKAIKKMIDEYGCNPKDIITCIGPSIRKCHFEVDEDVMRIFKDKFNYTGRINEIIEKGRVINGLQKFNIDTTLIIKISLEEVGIRKENIFDCGICTVCNKDLFHSYRADKENSGRNGAFIGMF